VTLQFAVVWGQGGTKVEADAAEGRRWLLGSKKRCREIRLAKWSPLKPFWSRQRVVVDGHGAMIEIRRGEIVGGLNTPLLSSLAPPLSKISTT